MSTIEKEWSPPKNFTPKLKSKINLNRDIAYEIHNSNSSFLANLGSSVKKNNHRRSRTKLNIGEYIN